MIALTRAQRAALLFVSASAYLAWFSGFDERLEAQGIGGTPTPTLTIVSRAAPRRVASVIVRDPFAGGPISGAESAAADSGPEVDASSTLSGNQVTTVPNIATSGGSSGFPSGVELASNRDAGNPETLVVRATIVGSNPVAYVANGSTMDIVRIGDRLGERRIAKIDIRGIAFADGSRLDLPGAFIATPAPQKPNSSITLKLEDLRKLVRRAERPPLAPGAGSATLATAPAASPSPATYPTPGPLPTIDPRGIPVGTNPTPDASGPTPYPNPYPYAPPRR